MKPIKLSKIEYEQNQLHKLSSRLHKTNTSKK